MQFAALFQRFNFYLRLSFAKSSQAVLGSEIEFVPLGENDVCQFNMAIEQG